MIRIIIVDDQDLIRQGLTLYLESAVDLTIVGTADNGIDAIEQVKKLDPDVVLLDLEMPDFDGWETSKVILKQSPTTKIIVFTSHTDPTSLRKAIQAGVKGYLLKDASAEELANAIRAINQGYFQLSPGLLEKLLVETGTLPSNQAIISLMEETFSKCWLVEKKVIESNHQKLLRLCNDQLDYLKLDLQREIAALQIQFATQVQCELDNFREHLNFAEVNQRHLEQQQLLRSQIFNTMESCRYLERKVDRLSSWFFASVIAGLIAIIGLLTFA